jgi:hypothetical protein
MSVFSGPNVSDSGLVFAYDMYNTDKSWKGAPAVNLAAGVISVGNGNVPTTTVTDIKPDGTIGTVREHSAETISDPNRTVSCGSYNLTAGETYTISFYVKNINCTGFGGNLYSPTLLRSIDAITYPAIFTDRWARVVKTFVVPNEGPNPVQLSPQIFRDGGLGKFRLTDIQIEQNSFASPYINGTRSNTQALLDQTGKNTITASNVTYSSSNTFSFNGGTQRMDISNTIGPISNNFTISAWINSTDIAATQNILSMNAPYFMRITNSRVRFNVFAAGTWLFQNGTTVLSSNTWYYFTMVYNFDASLWIGYINGELEFSVAKSGTLPTSTFYGYVGYTPQAGEQSNFFGQIATVQYYNRALTQIEVRQNFNALRGRFGI